MQNTAAHVSPKPYQSYRRLPDGFLQRHLQPSGGQVDPPSEVRSEEMVPGLWCRVETLPGAGGRQISWPAQRDRVTRSCSGRRRRGLVWFSSSLHAAVGILLVAEGLNAKDRVLARKGRRRRNTSGGRRPGSPRIGWPAGVRQGRPMAARTSGRWRTGLPPAWRSLRPPVTGGGGRRPGSPRTGRPAGHCQGHTFFPRPPSGPTTFWTVARGFGNPVGHPGVSRGVCSLSGEVTPERR